VGGATPAAAALLFPSTATPIPVAAAEEEEEGKEPRSRWPRKIHGKGWRGTFLLLHPGRHRWRWGGRRCSGRRRRQNGGRIYGGGGPEP
jgi:hypothetical protein